MSFSNDLWITEFDKMPKMFQMFPTSHQSILAMALGHRNMSPYLSVWITDSETAFSWSKSRYLVDTAYSQRHNSSVALWANIYQGHMGQDDSCHLSRPFKIPQVLLYLLQLLSLDKMASLSSAFPTVSAKVWRTGQLLFLHLSNMIWKSLLVIIFTFRRSTKFSLLSKLHELVL